MSRTADAGLLRSLPDKPAVGSDEVGRKLSQIIVSQAEVAVTEWPDSSDKKRLLLAGLVGLGHWAAVRAVRRHVHPTVIRASITKHMVDLSNLSVFGGPRCHKYEYMIKRHPLDITFEDKDYESDKSRDYYSTRLQHLRDTAGEGFVHVARCFYAEARQRSTELLHPFKVELGVLDQTQRFAAELIQESKACIDRLAGVDKELFGWGDPWGVKRSSCVIELFYFAFYLVERVFDELAPGEPKRAFLTWLGRILNDRYMNVEWDSWEDLRFDERLARSRSAQYWALESTWGEFLQDVARATTPGTVPFAVGEHISQVGCGKIEERYVTAATKEVLHLIRKLGSRSRFARLADGVKWFRGETFRVPSVTEVWKSKETFRVALYEGTHVSGTVDHASKTVSISTKAFAGAPHPYGERLFVYRDPANYGEERAICRFLDDEEVQVVTKAVLDALEGKRSWRALPMPASERHRLTLEDALRLLDLPGIPDYMEGFFLESTRQLVWEYGEDWVRRHSRRLKDDLESIYGPGALDLNKEHEW